MFLTLIVFGFTSFTTSFVVAMFIPQIKESPPITVGYQY
jgi:hypothetical protein